PARAPRTPVDRAPRLRARRLRRRRSLRTRLAHRAPLERAADDALRRAATLEFALLRRRARDARFRLRSADFGRGRPRSDDRAFSRRRATEVSAASFARRGLDAGLRATKRRGAFVRESTRYTPRDRVDSR